MSVAWHPKRWWGLCMSEDKKKEIDPIFTDKVRVLTYFGTKSYV